VSPAAAPRGPAAADVFDVAVVGGGCAGVAAAVSAARAGARTLLVERTDLLGGNAALANVHTLCGLYRAADEGDALPAHPGFPLRFVRALAADGACGSPERAGRVWVLPLHPPALARTAARLCAETRGLALRLETLAVGLEFPQAGGPARLALRSAREQREARAHVVVDASGDAAAAALAGAPLEQAAQGELQLPSYIFRMGGVDTRELRGFGRLRVTHAVAGAARAGALPPGCESVLVRAGGEPGDVYVTLNLPRPGAWDPLDAKQRAELEAVARGRAELLAEFLRRTRPAFAQGRIRDFPRALGVRETRRLLGRARVSRADVLAGRRTPDEVALSTWPIELWHDHRRALLEYPEGPCSVPLGALVSRGEPRLAAGGRCVSASHEALGALRVLGTALATGEAAGVAAALAADAGAGLDAIAPAAVRDHILRLASGEAP
jgi:hypothetical protein